ncbi:MAG: hypothetical protein LQ342_008532 [Letrouitia transgressa]|nr:MAG: hypothetical protein LQ342_008532 [Letrouitia transgressa]
MELVETLKAATAAAQSDGGQKNKEDLRTITVPVTDWLRRVTLDIIGIAGMGRDFGALYNTHTAVNEAYQRAFGQPGSDKVMMIIETLANLFPVYLLTKLPLKQNRDIYDRGKGVRKSHDNYGKAYPGRNQHLARTCGCESVEEPIGRRYAEVQA